MVTHVNWKAAHIESTIVNGSLLRTLQSSGEMTAHLGKSLGASRISKSTDISFTSQAKGC
jgi:hypothetical protein